MLSSVLAFLTLMFKLQYMAGYPLVTIWMNYLVGSPRIVKNSRTSKIIGKIMLLF